MKPSLLVVDDEASIRGLVRASLRGTYEVLEAADGEEALALLRGVPVQALLTDLRMPGMNGLQLLGMVRAQTPFLPILILTGVEDVTVAVEAMKLGADDYLIKPFSPELLALALDRARERQALRQEVKDHEARLELHAAERTLVLQQALREVKESYRQTLMALGAALDTRDVETQAHSCRVARYAVALAKELEIGGPELEHIEWGVLLHDIGKIGIPDAILLKQGPLTPEEWTVMRRHPALGFKLLEGIPFLKEAAPIVYCHHERFDGSGYPRGLAGEVIPIGARIFSVVDALDAMTSDRPYSRARPFGAAREEIRRCAGSQFDPRIVEAFLAIPEPDLEELRGEPG